MKRIKTFESFVKEFGHPETEEERKEKVRKERQEKINEIFKNKNMIRFKLEDENNEYKEYSIDLNFKNEDEFLDFMDEDKDFETFMEKMECGNDKWCGVHDGTGGTDDDGIEWFGYHSYEIEDFDTAISKWREFFKSKGKLIE